MMRRSFRHALRSTRSHHRVYYPLWYLLLFRPGTHERGIRAKTAVSSERHEPATKAHAEAQQPPAPSILQTLTQGWSAGFAIGLSHAELRLAERLRAGDASAEQPLAWARGLARLLQRKRGDRRDRRRGRDNDNDNDRRTTGESALYTRARETPAPVASPASESPQVALDDSAPKKYKGKTKSAGELYTSVPQPPAESTPKFERRFIEDLRDTLVVMKLAATTKAAEKLIVDAVNDGVLRPAMDLREAVRAIRARVSQ